MVYFDYNATTPVIPAARQAWLDATEQFPGNPSSQHRIGTRTDHSLNEARDWLADYLGCTADSLIWTSGATEANNMVLHHALSILPPDAEVWISAIEHPCVMQSTLRYFPQRHRLIPVFPSGIVDLDWVSHELADKRPGLVAVMAANNETGILQPWREIQVMCQQYQVPFFCDAVQWIGKLPPEGLGQCDYLSGCAHKFGGPKGIGFLKCPSGKPLKPLLVGGPQEEGRRAGTENVAGVLSMMAALRERAKLIAAGEHENRLRMRHAFETKLLHKLDGCRLTGGNVPRLWNTVSAIMPQTDCRVRWVVKMDKLGYAVSTGSACSSGKEEPSHVLSALGLLPWEAGRVLRFSGGWETTEELWEDLLEGLLKARTLMES